MGLAFRGIVSVGYYMFCGTIELHMANKMYSFDNKSTYNELLGLHFKCLQGMHCSEYISHKGYVILFNNFIKIYHYKLRVYK